MVSEECVPYNIGAACDRKRDSCRHVYTTEYRYVGGEEAVERCLWPSVGAIEGGIDEMDGKRLTKAEWGGVGDLKQQH